MGSMDRAPATAGIVLPAAMMPVQLKKRRRLKLLVTGVTLPGYGGLPLETINDARHIKWRERDEKGSPMLRPAVLPYILASFAVAPSVLAERLRYDVYVGGVHAAEVAVNIGLDGTRYGMAIEARTRGMTDWLLSWRLSAIVEGERGEAGVSPAYQKSIAKFRGEARSTDIRFGEGRILGWTVTPPEEPDADRTPATLEDTRGAVDMMSGLLGALFEANSGQCPKRAQVFDGRRRTDLIFQDMGEAQLKRTSYGIYEGTAFVCRMTVNRMAGYLKRETEWNKAEDRTKPATIFLQQIAGGLPPIPVRIESDLTLGQVIVHLTGIDGSDQWPKLAPLPPD